MITIIRYINLASSLATTNKKMRLPFEKITRKIPYFDDAIVEVEHKYKQTVLSKSYKAIRLAMVTNRQIVLINI